ncbi:MAG TPA: hypothetical protein VGT02_13045 [Methylomirabilota bacterium]|nr:hypothetical protein [Methylomirabilota bacterium]
MTVSRMLTFAVGRALALAVLPAGRAAAATQVTCPATTKFKIVAQSPESGWAERANDIAGTFVTSQALQIAAGRWLLVCGYNVNGAKGLISRQVQFGNCHTSDNAAVSTSAKFLCS